MKGIRFNRVVRGQLDQLRREGLLDEARHAELAGRYPVERWDWGALGRWFLILGGVTVAAGGVMLARELFEFTLVKLAVLLALVLFACFGAGWRLRDGPYVWTRRSLELLGGLTLIGLTFTLGLIYSSGSGNWPALLLIDLCLLLPLAYLLRNLLLLVLSAVVFFLWFGGFTGYSSGWGAYWFGMNYPLRFLLAGLAMAGVGVLHRRAEAGLEHWRGYCYVWLASGVFFAEMALWLLSLFGNFGDASDWSYRSSPAQLLLFNLLWGGGNVVLLLLGARYTMRMLRGFAVTFLIIQGYTLFFWYIAGALGPILSLFVAGGAALALVWQLELRRRLAVEP